MGVLYGVPVWGFAMLWLVIAGALVLRAGRNGMPFSLTWWSFTLPVGTCVTGTSVLDAETGLDAFAWAAVALFAVLVCARVVVAARSAHGALTTGRLLLPASRPA